MKSADRLRNKLIKEYNILNPIHNYKRLTRISKKLDLPLWWVELVVIEYFECRRFLENGKATVFDFGIFESSLIDTIPDYKVVIPSGYIFMQNVRPVDLSYRAPALMTGHYVEPLDKADLIPEGVMSNYAFPFIGNPLNTNDPKENFNWYAIVFDDDKFYQWKISELYEINDKSTWFKSELFDLLPLWKLTTRIHNCKNKISNNGENQNEIRDDLMKLFASLEQTRRPLRKKVLQYHNKKKITESLTVDRKPQPPLLTFIDTLKPLHDGYAIESHLESLFYSASLENYANAENSRKDEQDTSLYQDALLNEIKYSSLCIICSVLTLESYINSIFSKYLPEDSKVFERSSLQQKWLYVPYAMSLPFAFSPKTSPFKIFLDLISWRNKAVHHTPEFVKAKTHKSKHYKGLVSAAFGTFNRENAKLAIRCEEEMILKLSEGDTIPLPKWIKKKN
jgi:hypothetical protein